MPEATLIADPQIDLVLKSMQGMLTRIDERIGVLEKRQAEQMSAWQAFAERTGQNFRSLAGRMLVSRVNEVRAAEGKAPLVSLNEECEILESQKQNPDPDILLVPAVKEVELDRSALGAMPFHSSGTRQPDAPQDSRLRYLFGDAKQQLTSTRLALSA